MSDPLRDLVESARSGDRDARNDLLQRHLPSLRAFIRRPKISSSETKAR